MSAERGVFVKTDDNQASCDTRNWKLLVDPLLRKGRQKLFRYDGCVVGSSSNSLVYNISHLSDPRTNMPRFWARSEPLDLAVPSFKMDENYVGRPPEREVSFFDLNDNVNRQFLADLCQKCGDVSDVKIYYHPTTRKHTGLARVIFNKVRSAQACVARYDKATMMGRAVRCLVDVFGRSVKAAFHQLTTEPVTFSSPSAPPLLAASTGGDLGNQSSSSLIPDDPLPRQSLAAPVADALDSVLPGETTIEAVNRHLELLNDERALAECGPHGATDPYAAAKRQLDRLMPATTDVGKAKAAVDAYDESRRRMRGMFGDDAHWTGHQSGNRLEAALPCSADQHVVKPASDGRGARHSSPTDACRRQKRRRSPSGAERSRYERHRDSDYRQRSPPRTSTWRRRRESASPTKGRRALVEEVQIVSRRYRERRSSGDRSHSRGRERAASSDDEDGEIREQRPARKRRRRQSSESDFTSPELRRTRRSVSTDERDKSSERRSARRVADRVETPTEMENVSDSDASAMQGGSGRLSAADGVSDLADAASAASSLNLNTESCSLESRIQSILRGAEEEVLKVVSTVDSQKQHGKMAGHRGRSPPRSGTRLVAASGRSPRKRRFDQAPPPPRPPVHLPWPPPPPPFHPIVGVSLPPPPFLPPFGLPLPMPLLQPMQFAQSLRPPGDGPTPDASSPVDKRKSNDSAERLGQKAVGRLVPQLSTALEKDVGRRLVQTALVETLDMWFNATPLSTPAIGRAQTPPPPVRCGVEQPTTAEMPRVQSSAEKALSATLSQLFDPERLREQAFGLRASIPKLPSFKRKISRRSVSSESEQDDTPLAEDTAKAAGDRRSSASASVSPRRISSCSAVSSCSSSSSDESDSSSDDDGDDAASDADLPVDGGRRLASSSGDDSDDRDDASVKQKPDSTPQTNDSAVETRAVTPSKESAEKVSPQCVARLAPWTAQQTDSDEHADVMSLQSGGSYVPLLFDHCYPRDPASQPVARVKRSPAPLQQREPLRVLKVNLASSLAPLQPPPQPPVTVAAPPPPRVLFKRRGCDGDAALLCHFLKDGLDEEDMQYLRLGYEELLVHDVKSAAWADNLCWFPQPPVTARVRGGGCARTDGLGRSNKCKRPMGRRTCVTERTLAQSQQDASAARQQAQLGREVRSAQRRLLSTLGGDVESDLLRVNQLKLRKKLIKFARSRIHGWGLFALEAIGADEMIVEYVGEKIRLSVADRREQTYARKGIGSSYLFRIDSDLVIDATKTGALARFINHSCNPNCYAKIITVEGDKRIVIYSKQFIDVGDEITYDYKFPHEDEKIACHCSAPNCRGSLN